MKNNIFFLLFIVTAFSAQSQEDINLSNGNFFEGEPYIKANPDDSNHLVVAWMGFINAAENLKINVRTSFDAGESWSTITTLDHAVEDYTSADPSIAFLPNGDVVVAYIDWTGDDIDEPAGGIQISTSTDGGLTFNAPNEVLNIAVLPAQRVIDRPWITIDRSNTNTSGNIYITSMNARESEPEFHPYISTSTDGGQNFTFKFLDDENWLSGALIGSPMPTPTTQSDGMLYAIYPSFVFSQNPLAQYILASSADGGDTFNYQTVFSSNDAIGNVEPLSKKGYLLREDPSNVSHLAFFFLANTNDDLDIYFLETFNAGANWSAPLRINDDPVANGKLQDLVWADFNTQGDLIVTWRDRRNAPDSGFETDSEIWAAYRPEGATTFETNFQITDETVAYNDVLSLAGNDFMSVQLVGDVVHTTWGDTRTGNLNIWYQRSETDGTILSINDLSLEVMPFIVFPNPALNSITIKANDWTSLKILTIEGKQLSIISNKENTSEQIINIAFLSQGTYIFEVNTPNGIYTQKVIKK